MSELLASSAPKIAASLQKRRLIPFKSLPTQMGTVAALTYCLKQHPSLLTLSQVSYCLSPIALSNTPPCPLAFTVVVCDCTTHLHCDGISSRWYSA